MPNKSRANAALTQDRNNDEFGKEDREHFAIRIINPDKIEELAITSPVLAAHKCREGVTLLEIGTQKIRRRYVAASYLIACNIKHDEKHLERFAFDYHCMGFAQKQDTEKTRDRLIYHVFDFNFSKIEGTTPNRAYSYAYALEAYLKEDTDPEQVKALVMKRGPEKLYRETLERNKLAKALAKYR